MSGDSRCGVGDKLAHFCSAQATSILVKRSWLLRTFTRLPLWLGTWTWSPQLLDSAWPLNLALLVCTDCIQMNSDWIHWSSSVRSDFFLSKTADEAGAFEQEESCCDDLGLGTSFRHLFSVMEKMCSAISLIFIHKFARQTHEWSGTVQAKEKKKCGKYNAKK